MLNYLKKRYLPFNFNMLMENIQKCIFFLIFHLAHFFCSRVYYIIQCSQLTNQNLQVINCTNIQYSLYQIMYIFSIKFIYLSINININFPSDIFDRNLIKPYELDMSVILSLFSNFLTRFLQVCYFTTTSVFNSILLN